MRLPWGKLPIAYPRGPIQHTLGGGGRNLLGPSEDIALRIAHVVNKKQQRRTRHETADNCKAGGGGSSAGGGWVLLREQYWHGRRQGRAGPNAANAQPAG